MLFGYACLTGLKNRQTGTGSDSKQTGRKMGDNLDSDRIDGRAAGGVLTINLDALQHNYRLLRAGAKPAGTAAVVKADAYGIGAGQAAPALYEAGCRMFFVAQLIEAFRLRPYLPADAEIAVLNDIQPGMEATAAEAGFLPVLNSLSSVEAWEALCREKGRRLPAMLQLDSGMSRLGLDAAETRKLAANPEIFNRADIRYILSHLACSDERANSMNRKQLASFKKLLKKLPAAPVSLANSGGIYLEKAYRFDLVRPGIALYGVDPHGLSPSRLQPVIRLEARVIRTCHVPAGVRIGYGGTYTTMQPAQVATVAVGYADGWLRSLGNCGSAFFSGHRMPVIGRVSMDSMMLDVTALGKAAPRRGDLVELIGPNQPLEHVARDAGTIPYEILTSLGHRYDRHYIRSG
jgi:alanine racemase